MIPTQELTLRLDQKTGQVTEYPKVRAHDAHSCQVAKEATVELAYQIVGDRRRRKSLKLPGFAADLADWFCLVAKRLGMALVREARTTWMYYGPVGEVQPLTPLKVLVLYRKRAG